MHGEERNTFNQGYGHKVNCHKLIFNNGFKDQMNVMSSLDKPGRPHSYKFKKLCPSSIVDAFKTLETFKDLVNEAQEEQTHYAEMNNSNEGANFNQLISLINIHISLIFRVCENSDEVNRHFTQNIIKYDSLLLIAFDP